MISSDRNIVKKIVFNILIVSLFILFALVFINSNYFGDMIEFISGNKKENNLITQLSINGIILPYDKATSTFYFPINNKDMIYEKELEIIIKSDKKLTCIIEKNKFSKDLKITKKINFDDTLELYVETLFYYKKYNIKFTNLPIINISNNEENDIGENYSNSKFYIIDPNYNENETVYQYFSDAKIRLRGASSLFYPKKSYRLKLVSNKNVSLLGMRNDSTWILDAMYTDDSCARTKLSYEVWNMINNDLIEGEEYATLNCRYVEIFIDDEYAGLYLLKEPIDDKSLNLNQDSLNNSGVLIKGIKHGNIDFDNEKISNIKSDVYDNLELKYPKNMKDNSLYWEVILSKMSNYYSGNYTYDNISDTFNIDNFINYRLFLLIIFANDNYEPKNVYFSINDLTQYSKVILTPWDLDFTFGLEYYIGVDRGKKLYDKVTDIYPIIGVEKNSDYSINIKNRWNQIKSNGLNINTIDELLDKYYQELVMANSIDREYSKWIQSDLKSEFNEIKDWWHTRFYVVDEYINSL